MEVVEIFSHAENTTALEVDVAVEGAGDAGFGEGVEEDLARYALQVGVGFGLRHSGDYISRFVIPSGCERTLPTADRTMLLRAFLLALHS